MAVDTTVTQTETAQTEKKLDIKKVASADTKTASDKANADAAKKQHPLLSRPQADVHCRSLAMLTQWIQQQ